MASSQTLSYWLDTAPRFTGGAAGPVGGRVDVAVIGGGFTGLSAALALAKMPGLDPNARNRSGETPLMMAAQLDLPQAVTILLNAGADPNIATDRNALRPQGEAWRQVSLGGYYSVESYYAVPDLQHDQRTALMYAAANASLPVIQMLLRAGADKTARDSKGLTAAEYLTGNGPVPANPRISEQARAEVLRLLSP